MTAIHIQQQFKEPATSDKFQLSGVNVLIQAAVKGTGAQHAALILQGSNIPDFEESWEDLDTILVDGTGLAKSASLTETAFAFGRVKITQVTGTNALLYLGVSSAESFAGAGGSSGGGGGGGGQTDGLTNAELRAVPVGVLVTNADDIGGGGSTGPIQTDALTNDELRATAVAVVGPVTNAEMRAQAIPVSGPATDAQMRAAPIPVSVNGVASSANQTTQQNTLDAMNAKMPSLSSGSLPVVGPVTNTQLRSSPLEVVMTWAGLTNTELRAAPLAVTMTGAATATGQASQLDALSAIAGYVDGLETLIGNTNTLLTQTNGYVDNVESLLGQIYSAVDGLEALIAATNTTLGTINSTDANISANTLATKNSTDAVKTSVDAVANKLPVLGPQSGANSLSVILSVDSPGLGGGSAPAVQTVGGKTVQIKSTVITRPADTTAYVSGDLVANSTTAASVVPYVFANAARVAGGSGMIRRVKLQASAGAVGTTFRAHIFRASPTSFQGDNAQIIIASSQDDYLGYLEVTLENVFASPNGGAVGSALGEMSFACPAGATSIFALLEVRGAYTPSSAMTFALTLDILQD